MIPMLCPRLVLLLPLVTLTSCRTPVSEPATTGAPGTVSLAGEWRFALDREDAGVREAWHQRDLTDRIKLPGVLQAQGYGDEISPTTPWVVSLGDSWWKLQPESLRAKFSRPGAVQVPFLSQPPRHYLGVAWYQRDVVVPPEQAGLRQVLFLERPHWETTVWVDDQVHPANNSLVAPHVTDVGILPPGRHRITIRIDNRQIVNDPADPHHTPDAHAHSDAMASTWNGIAGRIELQSTPLVWLDDVQVFPNVRKKSALVRVAIGNRTGAAGTGTLTLRVGGGAEETLPVTWAEGGGHTQVELALGANAETWDAFNPARHRVTVSLAAGRERHERQVLFGLREVAYRDRELLINGRPVFLRMTHFGGDFPLTGYPATDVESWRKIIRQCQAFGLNGMRFHSWCPPEAAFAAADELGFYLQTETGMWAAFNPGSPFTRYLEEETPRLLQAYGNHPSFILMSPSNEPGGRYTEITPKWAAEWYERDPRRLYASGTGWSAPEQVTGGAQFAVLVRFRGGELRNIKGWFGADYRKAVETVHIPVLAHEVGQWCAYPDFDIIRDFTGYLQPGNYTIFRHLAEQTGVAEFNAAFAWSSGRFQLACYKEEIEANLRTAGLAGFQLLDIRDYLGQGTALIGLLDAFWKPKDYVTAGEFRRFNGVTVPTVRLATRTFSTADTLATDVELYHAGAKPLAGARPYWKLVRLRPAQAGRSAYEPPQGVGRAGSPWRETDIVARGEFGARDIPVGKNHPLGRISLPLADVPAPAAYRLVIGLADTDVENDWNVWVYPAAEDATNTQPSLPPKGGTTYANADVVITSRWNEAEAALAQGGRVLFVPTEADLPRAKSPAMSRTPVFWNIQMTVRPPRNPTPRFDGMLGLLCESQHPALAEFPTEPNCDWQWTPLIAGVRSVNLTEAPRELRPIVSTIDDWNRNWRLGVIFEARVGQGRLLVSTIDIRKADGEIGAKQLGRSLLGYMAGDQFAPKVELTVEQLRALWQPPTNSEGGERPRERVFDRVLDDGSGKKGT